MRYRLAAKETAISIPGKAGHLEAAVGEPEPVATALPESPVFAVVCHPDPLQRGTMDNKVVTTAARALRNIGAHTVRFNYRGVSGSEGHYGEGAGEADDALAVIQWIKANYPKARIALVGFSFGAYITLRLAPALKPAPLFLVAIAPVVTHSAFDVLEEVTSPWWVLLGDQDELVSAEAVQKWAKARTNAPEFILFKECTHFFHGQLTALRETLEATLKSFIV